MILLNFYVECSDFNAPNDSASYKRDVADVCACVNLQWLQQVHPLLHRDCLFYDLTGFTEWLVITTEWLFWEWSFFIAGAILPAYLSFCSVFTKKKKKFTRNSTFASTGIENYATRVRHLLYFLFSINNSFTHSKSLFFALRDLSRSYRFEDRCIIRYSVFAPTVAGNN